MLSCYFIVPYAYLYFTLSITFTYFRYYVNIDYIKTRTYVKFSIVPEEGWFGQPKFSVGFYFSILFYSFLFFIKKNTAGAIGPILPNPQKIMYNLKVTNMAQRIGHPSPQVPPSKKLIIPHNY